MSIVKGKRKGLFHGKMFIKWKANHVGYFIALKLDYLKPFDGQNMLPLPYIHESRFQMQ